MAATYAVLTGDFVKSRGIAGEQYDTVLYQLLKPARWAAVTTFTAAMRFRYYYRNLLQR